MAKTQMTCPFSGRLCKDCAPYRGRHYYLCFCNNYRGYLAEPEEVAKASNSSTSGANHNKKFEIPAVIKTRARDPFIINLEQN